MSASGLQRLSLDAYRGISGLVLHDLKPLSLIVGANNSGKSSILEAIALLLRAPDPGQWVHVARQRDLDMPLEDALWSMFPGGGVFNLENGPQQSRSISLGGTLGDQTERRVQARCLATERWSDNNESELVLSVELKVDQEKPSVLEFRRTSPTQWGRGTTFKAYTITSAAHRSTRGFVENLSHVVDSGRKALAIELACVFDPEIRNLDVVELAGRRSVRVTHQTRGVVDLSSFGDGLRRAVLFSLVLARAAGGVLLIDEIDVGIHPAVMNAVFAKLCTAAEEVQAQVIMTTHSLEAVDALVAALAERNAADEFAAYWVQRKDGQHAVRRYDFAKLCRLREGGLDIR
ncbi:MAG: ATP-binding protein [Xanthomonadales bacterium]|jgi:predicted ATP-dependent endonuclease of OLD family|nr:ATP-binding protein [Xanthomonadales bacterium]